MKDAPPRLQWSMNDCLAYIGIHHAVSSAALDIGERLEVLKDYPTRRLLAFAVRRRSGSVVASPGSGLAAPRRS